ncbi:MAG: hypothetical protein IH900_02050 [Proteobacteria bacterium]|nr:hypothetical protein [Pseudomonadota bacterium]
MTENRDGRIDFAEINRTALADLPNALRHWLPNARTVGEELVALNPTRSDRRPGSFKINISNGRWADFATGDRGGDVVSLIACLDGTGQVEAARRLAEALGIRAEL